MDSRRAVPRDGPAAREDPPAADDATRVTGEARRAAGKGADEEASRGRHAGDSEEKRVARPDRRTRRLLPSALPLPERREVARALRTESVGGAVLLLAALAALVWANSPWRSAYATARAAHFGPAAIGLHLTVAHWTSEGLLTVFFLVAGVELKRELVLGELSRPADAVLPVICAVCGMAVPAGVYLTVTAAGGGSADGWAVPTATDIAFALTVLAVLDTHLPPALRAFLLTLAVVDDLGAIVVIAVFFSSHLCFVALAGAAAALALFGLLQRLRVRGWWWYVPLGLVIWTLTYRGGVHATVCGVVMGVALRIRPAPGEREAPGARAEHLLRPVSAAVAVPLFALFTAGVPLSAASTAAVFTTPESLGVVLGLVVGKPAGVLGGAWLAVRCTRARLAPGLRWADVLAVALLAGIGFTVSLLIGALAFTDPADVDRIKAAVLIGSVAAALPAAALLRRRDRAHRGAHHEPGRHLG